MNVDVVEVLVTYHPEFMNAVEDCGSDEFKKGEGLLLLGGVMVANQELMLYAYPVFVK